MAKPLRIAVSAALCLVIGGLLSNASPSKTVGIRGKIVFNLDDRTMKFTIGDGYALFGPNSPESGHRPPDAIGGEYRDCSTREIRCFDAAGTVLFALDLSAIRQNKAYQYLGWSFWPKCVEGGGGSACEFAFVSFAGERRQTGFMLFGEREGITAFSVFDPPGSLHKIYTIDRRNSFQTLLGAH